MNPPGKSSLSILLQTVAGASRSVFFLVSCLWILTTPDARAIVDINNNRVSDLWEIHYNDGQRFTTFDPEADPDGDGWTHDQEAAAGTDPFDANPPNGYLSPTTTHYPATYSTNPETGAIYVDSPETISIEWPTLPGKQYTLLYSTDLSPSAWLPLEDPYEGNGSTVIYNIPLTGEGNTRPDRLFWRVGITDAIPGFDSDSDGLNNYEEYLAGTDPVISDSDGDTLSDYAELIAGTNPNNPDEDGDGLTDPFEIAAGTDSKNQDTDGDGIPDSLDSQPLLSVQAFADADGDGISDDTDPDDNNPRGQKPSISSENASGNPLSDVATSEDLRFVITVSNPAGPAPSASNLTMFLNGTPEAANITDIAEPSGGSASLTTRGFLITWDAKVTTGYPEQTLQNISLRFRDSQNATTWLNLARIDVAEWEGMVAAIVRKIPTDTWDISVVSHHHDGKKLSPRGWAGFHLGQNSTWYRGPRTISLQDTYTKANRGQAEIGEEMRYPLFIFSGQCIASAPIDISDPLQYPQGFWYLNDWSSYMKMVSESLSTFPWNITVQAGQQQFFPYPEFNGEDQVLVAEARYWNTTTDEEKAVFSNLWPIRTRRPYRTIDTLNFYSSSPTATRPSEYTSSLYAAVEAMIKPYAGGSFEEPGVSNNHLSLPLTASYSQTGTVSLLPIQSGQWHKLVLRVGPDAGALSKGITLKIGTGEEGESPSQSGFSLQVKNPNSFTPLAIPADGKIEMLANSELYQKLTSLEGLTLYLKRDLRVSESHRIGLDLLPKGTTDIVHRLVALDLIPVEVVPDYNRDGKIDDNDRGKVTALNPFRWWINDDNDLTTAERGSGLQDIPNQIRSTGTGSVDDRDCRDLTVDGMRDLIDFFPLHPDLKSVLEILPASEYKYVLKHEDEALKFYEYPTCVVDDSEEGKEPNRHLKDVETGRDLASKALKLASTHGTGLSENMLANLKEGRGVLVVEGAKKTAKPLVLEILKKSDNRSIAKVDFPIRIADVEEMYRHVNMRDVTDGSGGHPTQTGEPSGYPDDLTNGKYVAFVHGYFVSGEVARGSNSNIFKRFHQLGSKARYIGISWYGDPPNPGINLALPPDYHLAVDNGLKTGIVAKVRLNFTQGSSLTVLAHSLGNSVVGSAIANHGLEVEQYYIINGAIALQAYDSSQTSNSSGHPDMKRNMTEDDWKPFYDHGNGEQQRLFASNWHELFAANSADKRNKLTWKDLFAKPEILSVAYNFYSPSDEVVENPDETEEFGDFWNLVDAATAGRHAWVQQEIAKGGQHALAASAFHDHNGGWRFNNKPSANTPLEAGYSKANLTNTGRRPYTVAEAAAEITNEDLKVVPYYLPFLYHALYDPAQGSATAGVSTNRYKLLGSGIPATSYAIAANRLDYLGNAGNFNMPADLKSSGGNSSWPVDSRQNNPTDWLHSDFNDVALQFLHPMYQKMIDLAELDNVSN